MHIFIDESGIQNQTGNSTVAVVYLEVKNLAKFDKDFKKILQDLKISNFLLDKYEIYAILIIERRNKKWERNVK